MCVLSLPCGALRALLDQRAELKSSLQRIISADLVFKLRCKTDVGADPTHLAPSPA